METVQCKCGKIALRINRYDGKAKATLRDGVYHTDANDTLPCRKPEYLNMATLEIVKAK